MILETRTACAAVLFVVLASCVVAEPVAERASPVQIRAIRMISLGKSDFDERGRRTPREPVRVIPYGGTFKLTMDVERIAPGRSIKWMAWFGNVVSQNYTETDDVKLYRSKKGPPTRPLDSIIGFEDSFRGAPVRPVARPGMEVRPDPDKPGTAYSFHADDGGHNTGEYPLWMRPVVEGENVLYALVHQRFVYHLMFRLSKRHHARYDLETQAHKVERMILPFTIVLVEDERGSKRLLAVYGGDVVVNDFPIHLLRRGAGVTVEKVETSPRRIWPEEEGITGQGPSEAGPLEGGRGNAARKAIDLDRYGLAVGPRRIAGVRDNCSGITFSPKTKTLFVVLDYPPSLVELGLDGSVIRRIALRGFSDTEGVTHAGGDTFFVVEEGRRNLVRVEVGSKTKAVSYAGCERYEIDPRPSWNRGLEGVSYDPAKKRLFIVKEKSPRKIYEVTLPKLARRGGREREKPKIGHPWDIEKKSLGLRDLSGVLFHRATGHLVLLSHESDCAVECTTAGKEVSRLEFEMPKAEGITMDDKGDIYVCSEPNLFYVFERKAPGKEEKAVTEPPVRSPAVTSPNE